MSQATLKPLAELYKSNQLDFGLYCWVSGIKKVLPSVSIMKCIELYQEFYDLSEFEMDSDSASVTYQRIKSKHKKYQDGL